MGVQARIVLYAPDTTTARKAATAAFDRIAALDEIMSDYRVDSELMALSRRAGAGPVEVSADLFTVLSIAQRIAEQSDGAFDVTIGPVVQLWRQARLDGRLPSESARRRALARTGWELLTLDPDTRTVTLHDDSMRLDLGGIAKGYAADAALEMLRENGISRALIEFGGDIVAGDPPPGESGWIITVPGLAPAHEGAYRGQTFGPEERAGNRTVILRNQAVSTSGDDFQYVVIDGKRYSHVVDPRTGLGLTNHVPAAVIAPKGVLSDALATALSVMGRDEGLAMIARTYPEIKAYFGAER